MIGLNNWAIIAICKHIIANNSLACAGVAVGVDEPMCYRVVISALEVIEPSLGVVVVASVAQRVDLRHCACGGEDVAPCVIGIGSHRRAAAIDQLDHIALQVQDVIIRFRRCTQLVDHGERLARLVIDEIEHQRDRAVRFDRLAHDLAALRQVLVRDRLRGGQVRASRRDSVLIRRLSLNRLDLVHGHDLAGRPCRNRNAASNL